MARFSAGNRPAAGSTTLPIISLYAAASIGGRIREIGVFNTTVNAIELEIVRLTTAGTSTALVAAEHGKHNNDSPDENCSAREEHTVAPTLGDRLGYRTVIGAAIGDGVIWTFGDGDNEGLVIPPGTANGIGVIVENGTGQITQAYIVWDE